MARRGPILNGCECADRDGLEALSKGDRNKINLGTLEATKSVNIDECFRAAEPNSNRWDYFIQLRKHGALYLEVHEVSEVEFDRVVSKAKWLREKINALAWPETDGRPLVVAPTKGITPFSAYGTLSKRLALHKISVVMKGDQVADLL